MSVTIIAHNAHGTSIQGPDCVKHPVCLSMLQRFLDFDEPVAGGDHDGTSVHLTARQIRDALKQVIVQPPPSQPTTGSGIRTDPATHANPCACGTGGDGNTLPVFYSWEIR